METDSGREGEREVSDRRVPDVTGPAIINNSYRFYICAILSRRHKLFFAFPSSIFVAF